jgi:D-alanine-D-alanine ligase
MEYMQKKKIGVIFGGASSEHKVSLISAKSVIENMPKDKYEIVMIGITKDGQWYHYSGDTAFLEDGTWELDPANRHAFISPDTLTHGLIEITDEGSAEGIYLDAVFPVLHGANGEDGTMQGLLTISAIPYVGCNTAASAICMDKAVTKLLIDTADIDQAIWDYFYIDDFKKDKDSIIFRIETVLGYPVFVKPANAGSSVGISKACDREQLIKAVDTAALHDKKIVVEEFIQGKEIECAVLGNNDVQVSVCGEIVPCNEFYDYEAKYIAGASELFIPARINKNILNEVSSIAAEAYKALGCSGMARVDFFVEDDGTILLNELNTIPGFTGISMYPKLFEASGIPYSELIDKLIQLAFER